MRKNENRSWSLSSTELSKRGVNCLMIRSNLSEARFNLRQVRNYIVLSLIVKPGNWLELNVFNELQIRVTQTFF